MHPLVLALGLVAQAPSTALLPLVGDGFAVDDLERADRELRREAERALGAALLKEPVTRARLDVAAARGLRCDRSAVFQAPPGQAAPLDCLLQAGVVCEAEKVMVGELSRGASGTPRLALLLVDVRAGALLWQAVVVGELDPARWSDAVARLLDPARAGAQLDARGAPAGTSWTIDGAALGAPPWPLAAGRHVVRAQRDGYVARELTVDLASGAADTVEVTLEAVPAPPPPAPVPERGIAWTPLAVGGGVAALGAVVAAVGVAPRVAHGIDAGALVALDAELQGDPAAADARVDEITAARQRVDDDAAAWNGWGQAAVMVGATVVGAGLGVVIGTLLAGSGAEETVP